MALLSEVELRVLEKKFSSGIPSAELVRAFSSRGERFSEATLRKYVQLGLLPRSQRIGTQGRHRGSSGLYPAETVRLVNAIKKSLENGATLGEIRLGPVGVEGDLVAIQQSCNAFIGRVREVVEHEKDRQRRAALRRERDRIEKVVSKNIAAIEKFAERLVRSEKRARG
ncbi:MAG: MerR family transcriptional regulator [Myxococcota bacterium]